MIIDLQVFQSVWIVLIIFFLFFRFRVGLAIYLAYLVLVPYMNFNILGINLQWNLINTLVLLLFVYKYWYKYNHPIDFTPFIPFVLYLVVSLFMMLFQDDTPFIYEIDAWRLNFMLIFFPFVLWNQIRVDYESYLLYKRVLLGCIFIASLYGLLLTLIPGHNPYIMAISLINESEFLSDYALAEGGGRLFGRISSVFSHPMRFGFFLGISAIYVYNIYIKSANNNKERLFTLFLLILIGVNFITCGIRSVLAGFFVTFIFYLIQARKIKQLFVFLILLPIIWLFIENLPDISGYISSMFEKDSSKSAVTGSSIEQRLTQLDGCFVEVKDCYLFGKGFNWHKYYNLIHGPHPLILDFESLVFIILCDSGLLGFALWTMMAVILFRFNGQVCKNIEKKSLLDALFIFYIAYSSVIGESGYMKYFMIFYVMLLGENLSHYKRIHK
ncbi:MAG: hypothetical protein J5658_00840 [Prevotella sp.]|nr:hypothetical protein [Prevotella sp.]